MFFTTFGLPKVVQTNQGTNFVSKTLKHTLQPFGITHSVSSAYHHKVLWKTLKSMLKKYCYDTGIEWDKRVPFILFAIRDVIQRVPPVQPN